MQELSPASRVSMNSTGGRVQVGCAFHPQNNLVAFCLCEGCLLPVCPTCVGIHGEEHKQADTHARFVELTWLREEVEGELRRGLRGLENLSQEYTADFKKKQGLREALKKKMGAVRERLSRELQRQRSGLYRALEQAEGRLFAELDSFLDRLHEQYRELQEEVHALHQSLNGTLNALTNPKLLVRTLIRFHTSELQMPIASVKQALAKKTAALKAQSMVLDVQQHPIIDSIRAAPDKIKLIPGVPTDRSLRSDY